MEIAIAHRTTKSFSASDDVVDLQLKKSEAFLELQVGAGAALSMMMFLMLVVITLIYFKVYKRDEHI